MGRAYGGRGRAVSDLTAGASGGAGISGRQPRSVAHGAACLAGGTRGCRWGAFHSRVGGVEAAVLRRLLDGRPEFHGRRLFRLNLLLFMQATVATKVDANTAWTDLAGGHGSGGNSRPTWRPHQSRCPRRRLPSCRLRCGSYAPHLCHERRRKPLFLCLGDDGSLVSCSFLKASAEDCSGWWSCW